MYFNRSFQFEIIPKMGIGYLHLQTRLPAMDLEDVDVF
jgi:hypothetical protein